MTTEDTRPIANLTHLAAAYVEYATWFVKEGAIRFTNHARKLREQLRTPLGDITRAAEKGPRSVENALASHIESLATIQSLDAHAAQWAAEKVSQQLAVGGERAWELLCEIVRLAPPEPEVLSFVGASAFEEWIDEDRAKAFFCQIEQQLRQEPKFIRVVQSAWNLPNSLRQLLLRLHASD